jgi:hypothetical protein
VAYVSDKSGSNGVYARPFPGPGAELIVSVGGGSEPVWGRSGKELFYRQRGEMMVVSVDAAGSTLTVGSPRKLFDDPYMPDIAGSAGGVANYDVSPAGDRFVVVESRSATTGAAPVNMTVIFNWFTDLPARALTGAPARVPVYPKSVTVRVRRLGGLHWLLPRNPHRQVVQQRVEHRDHEQRQ